MWHYKVGMDEREVREAVEKELGRRFRTQEQWEFVSACLIDDHEDGEDYTSADVEKIVGFARNNLFLGPAENRSFTRYVSQQDRGHQFSQYLDIEQSFFVWYRADRGYYWDEQAKPGGLFGEMIEGQPAGAQPPFLIEVPETTGFIGSKLLEQEPALFLKFADTPPTREGILDFANAYGMLTYGETGVLTPRYSYPEGREEEKPWKHGVLGTSHEDGRIYAEVFGESWQFWQNEIKDMKWTTQVWEWFVNQDTVALERVIHWSKDGVRYVLTDWEALSDATTDIMDQIKAARTPFSTGLLASKDHHGEILARFRPGDVLLPAQYLVQSRINKKLQKLLVRPRLLMGDHNRLEPYLVPEHLLAAMWFQFFRAATGEKRFRRCSICGLWADVTEKTKKWSKHPECANRERVRRSRAKARNPGHKMATRGL